MSYPPQVYAQPPPQQQPQVPPHVPQAVFDPRNIKFGEPHTWLSEPVNSKKVDLVLQTQSMPMLGNYLGDYLQMEGEMPAIWRRYFVVGCKIIQYEHVIPRQ